MWKEIINDAHICEKDLKKEEIKDNADIISEPTNFEKVMIESNEVTQTAKEKPFRIDKNKYVRYTDNDDYIMIRPSIATPKKRK